MHSQFDVLWMLTGICSLYAIIQIMTLTIKRGGKLTWIVVALWFLVLVGCAGFFAIDGAAANILKVSNSFEWPAGYVKGVATMANGNQVVPLVSPGRLQLYDAKWKFLRGWHIEALTSDFRVECPPNGMIKVYTAKGHHLYTFTEQGELVSSTFYDGDFRNLPANDSYIAVPTSPVGWLFSGQFVCLGVSFLGFLALGIVDKKTRRNPGKTDQAQTTD
jgi:hypothetical protein